MSNSLTKTEKKQKYIAEHDRLANLFATDRFAFEMERKRIIDSTIDEMNGTEEFKKKMRAQQKKLDKTLRGMKSAENRFAMIQALLWNHIVNNWQPAMQEYATTLESFRKSNNKQPKLSLIKKSTHHH